MFLERLRPETELGAWLNHEGAEVIRKQMEGWINLLSQGQQNRTLRGLRKSGRSQFLSFYNELAVGALLAASGYRVTYSPSVGDLTPDWLVEKDGRPICIVEVRTIEANAATVAINQPVRDLVSQLKQMDLRGWWVTIEPATPGTGIGTVASTDLPSLLQRHLAEWEPTHGTGPWRLTVSASPWALLLERVEGKKGAIFGPVEVHDARNQDVGRVLGQIRAKATKYSAVSEYHDLPLVVAVVPSFDVQVMASTFQWVGLKEGSFFQDVDPALSGVMYCGYTGVFEWYVKGYWENPTSTRPLEGLLGDEA